jgi:hypothetical protein
MGDPSPEENFVYDVSVYEMACPSYVSSIAVLGHESDILKHHLDSEVYVVKQLMCCTCNVKLLKCRI